MIIETVTLIIIWICIVFVYLYDILKLFNRNGSLLVCKYFIVIWFNQLLR